MLFQNPKDILSFYVSSLIHDGDTAVDATAGNGADTAVLSKAVGSGRVYAFDIQPQAIESARSAVGVADNVEFILASHSDMDKYVPNGVKCVVFNLGYLPGGDHSISTIPKTTIAAIEKALSLISGSGFVAVTMYRGGDTGFDEFNAVSKYISSLDYKKWSVITFDYCNRPNFPPVLAVIEKRNN